MTSIFYSLSVNQDGSGPLVLCACMAGPGGGGRGEGVGRGLGSVIWTEVAPLSPYLLPSAFTGHVLCARHAAGH